MYDLGQRIDFSEVAQAAPGRGAMADRAYPAARTLYTNMQSVTQETWKGQGATGALEAIGKYAESVKGARQKLLPPGVGAGKLGSIPIVTDRIELPSDAPIAVGIGAKSLMAKIEFAIEAMLDRMETHWKPEG